jgi:hypothetical protein
MDANSMVVLVVVLIILYMLWNKGLLDKWLPDRWKHHRVVGATASHAD